MQPYNYMYLYKHWVNGTDEHRQSSRAPHPLPEMSLFLLMAPKRTWRPREADAQQNCLLSEQVEFVFQDAGHKLIQ